MNALDQAHDLLKQLTGITVAGPTPAEQAQTRENLRRMAEDRAAYMADYIRQIDAIIAREVRS